MWQCRKCQYRSPDGEYCCWVEFALYHVGKQPPHMACIPVKIANKDNACDAFIEGCAYSAKTLKLVEY